MSHTIPAVFDSGVFRPLAQVELADGTHVVVQLEASEPTTGEEVDEETQQAWRDYVKRMESLTDDSPRDGLTNRDHDRILYGG